LFAEIVEQNVMKPVRATLKDVARVAGLSVAGTSYALRGHPRISAATVERVRRIASELGYRQDLRVASLMAHVRRGRHVTGRETLAFVWVSGDRKAPKQSGYLRVLLAGAKQRAEQLGCELEEFSLNDPHMTAPRLSDILRARGISGVIFSPLMHEHRISPEMDWSRFACVVIGNSDWRPVLHRVGHNHYRSMLLALEKLHEAGFRRPATVLGLNIHNRLRGLQAAAFQMNHPSPSMARKVIQFGTPGAKTTELVPWLGRERPDSLIVGWAITQKAGHEFRSLSADIRRVVTLDWVAEGSVSGIDADNTALAASAVDTVIAQLHRNERGIPAHPTTLLLDGTWREAAGTPTSSAKMSTLP
jgi:DNA-binding LacI/PurR family transcriptional regulator